MDVRAFHFACIRLLRDLSFIVTVLVQSHHIVLALSAMTQAGTYHGGYWCAKPSAEWYLFSWLIRVRDLCCVLLVLGTCFGGRLSAVVCQQVRRLLSSISLHISFPASKASPDQPSWNWGVGTSDLRNVPGHRRGLTSVEFESSRWRMLPCDPSACGATSLQDAAGRSGC